MTSKTDAELEEEQYWKDLEEVLNLRAGRRVIWAILDKTGMYRPSMTGNSTTFFREGMRNIGLMMTQDCMLFSELYMRMWKENALPEDFTVLNRDGKEKGTPSIDFTGSSDD